jgi:hypothetical protein
MIPVVALMLATAPPAFPPHSGAPSSGSLRVPPELGIVRWSRGYDAAAARARAQGKPLLVLFDEVPGCSTVLGFGERVLGHPLIADAMEQSFVPVVVYNNVSGDDRAVLERFGEPAWNNPVLRLFTPDGKPLARVDTGTPHQVATALVEALKASRQAVPPYLQLLVDEGAGAPARREYAMGCFWEGESTLGALDGVVSTRTGFVGGREVVQVTYAGAAKSLDATAREHGYAPVSGEFRHSPGDDKKQLQAGRFRFVPMTPLQKARVNAAPREGQRWLSPRQLELLKSGDVDVLEVDDVVEAYRRASR